MLRRKADSHKGDYGHVLVIGGSLNYSGAAVLAGTAAMRCGAGLVTLGLPRSVCLAVIKKKPLELMLLPLAETAKKTLSASAFKQVNDLLKKIDVLAIGPGITREKPAQQLVDKILKVCDKRMVVDADALMPGRLELLRKARNKVVITPHAAEMARLLGAGVEEVRKNRETIAKKAAMHYNLTVVLKGRRSVVADREGGLFINKTGNPGMASGGTGDVLCGIIAAFMAQGLEPFDAAKYAVYIHGIAGDLAAKEKTQLAMSASDIIEKLPLAIKKSS